MINRAPSVAVFAALLFTAIVGVGGVHAQGASDSFRILTSIGSDVTPPSSPGSLEAVPVATTQINLSWASSTDDNMIAGYRIYRDAVLIATTTGTTYSDAGRFPETLYSYYVTAFDPSGNVSASSTEVSTTTLAVVGRGSEGSYPRGSLSLELTKLEVIPGRDSVLIRYETRGDVRSVLRWGKTSAYEIGSLSEAIFSRSHETRITGLMPNTRYHFTIEGENAIGHDGVLTRDTFRTLGDVSTLAPANVRYFTARAQGEDVMLTWENPPGEDFSYVRVVRNEQSFPIDEADGWVLYEGDSTTARDTGNADADGPIYYAAFVYNDRGERSSGALATYRPKGDAEIGGPGTVGTTTPTTTTIDRGYVLTLHDVELVQEGERVPFVDGWATIDGSLALQVGIAYEKFPPHLKIIRLTVNVPERPEESFDFLLRATDDRTAYRAVLPPFGVAGEYLVRVSIMDFDREEVGYLYGRVRSVITHDIPQGGIITEGAWRERLFVFLRDYWLFLLSLILVVIIFEWYERRRRRQQAV